MSYIYHRLVDEKIVEESLSALDFDEEFNLVVNGLGTAGSIAAIVASREGKSVLGVESLNCMGGASTAGCVFGYYYGLEGGMFEEVNRKIDEERELFSWTGENKVCCHPDSRKHILEETALESGVDVRYNCRITGVYTKGERIVGVSLFDGVLKNISCSALIDASGDGNVLAILDCLKIRARESDLSLQPYTNAHTYYYGKEKRLIFHNTDFGYVDSLAKGVSEAVLESSKTHDWYDEKDHILVSIASLIGVRESGALKSKHTLTFEEALRGGYEGHTVFYAYSTYDTHTRDIAFESDIVKAYVFGGGLKRRDKALVIDIPIESFVSRDYSNLFVAGRLVDTTHDISCAVRMRRCMEKSGEAVGILASMILDKDFEAVDFNYLSSKLKESGCINSDDEINKLRESNTTLHLFLDKDEIVSNISQKERALDAVFSAYLYGSDIADSLAPLLNSEDKSVRQEAAFALALLKDRRAVSVLRDIVLREDKEGLEYGWGVDYLQRALYALSLVGGVEEISLFMNFLRKYTSDYDRFSIAFVSLLDIADRVGEERESIVSFLNQMLLTEEFSMLMKRSNNLYYNTSDYLRIYLNNFCKKHSLKCGAFEKVNYEILKVRERVFYDKCFPQEKR